MRHATVRDTRKTFPPSAPPPRRAGWWLLSLSIALAACGPRTADHPTATGGTTGGGGQDDLAVATPKFNPTLQADIDSLGCSAASCHGGTQVPVLKRLPVAQADIDANYAAFKGEANMGELSNILTKNLAGSGVTHTGGSSFANKQDAIYQRWLAWINGGTPE